MAPHHGAVIHRLIQNRPVLPVAAGEVLDHNLRTAKTSHVELFQQIHLAGVGHLGDVHAVILERNGQMSVIPAGARIDERLFAELPDRARLQQADVEPPYRG